MIPAATQTLAEFLASGLARIGRGHISFDHPQVLQKQKPCLNLYCYHIQASHRPNPELARSPRGSLHNGFEAQPASSLACQWFDLTFLVSVSDYTPLGEQHLLSDILTMMASYEFLPDQVIAPGLRGQGVLPIRVSTQGSVEDFMLWRVLQAPLRLALHITITVPCFVRHPVLA